MGVAADERQALSSLLQDLGPDAPTLCEGWTTRDLAAHLVVREHRPDAAPGILVPALAGYTQKVQDRYAAKPWAALVEQVRNGPSKFWPTAIGPLDELTNTAEFLVHHEDVRRAQPGWAPRAAGRAPAPRRRHPGRRRVEVREAGRQAQPPQGARRRDPAHERRPGGR